MLTPRDLFLALLVVLIWGINFVFIKWGVEEVPPLFLTALRYLCAALPAVFLVKRPQVKPGILVAYGLAIGFAQFGLLFMAIKLGMPAGLASLLMQLQAFFTVVLAMVFLGEKLTRFQTIGGLIAMAGVAVIATERVELTALIPLLMIILSAFFWGVANIASKKAGQIDMLSFVVWASLVPIVPLLALSLVVEGPAGHRRCAGQFQRAQRRGRCIQRLCCHNSGVWIVELSAQALSGEPDRPLFAAGAGGRHRLGHADTG